mmetsp:Transcript_25736/g.85780  ORF Transcript_25736/g.85780 Transcript_25736/m.85780 type:complete len:196 (+) Transcript_25736:61-648(+)
MLALHSGAAREWTEGVTVSDNSRPPSGFKLTSTSVATYADAAAGLEAFLAQPGCELRPRIEAGLRSCLAAVEKRAPAKALVAARAAADAAAAAPAVSAAPAAGTATKALRRKSRDMPAVANGDEVEVPEKRGKKRKANEGGEERASKKGKNKDGSSTAPEDGPEREARRAAKKAERKAAKKEAGKRGKKDKTAGS